jgi:hypothetical protein
MAARTSRLLLGLLAGVLALAIGLPIVQGALRRQTQAQRAGVRAAAQQRWQRATIGSYELNMVENGCHYQAAVHDGTATVHFGAAACAMTPETVEALFSLAARDGQRETLCDQRGCPCESRVDAAAEYDAQLGFPRRLVVEVALRPAWLTADLWRHIFATGGLPPCIDTRRNDIRVLALTPTH